MNIENWPELNFKQGKETYDTIHLWTQIVGKIKISKLPWINHSWHVTLFVTPIGLSTGDIRDVDKHFQIEFNFINHQLQIITSSGEIRKFGLKELSVASFYEKIKTELNDLGIDFKINPLPNEIENRISFNKDEKHCTYIPYIATKLHSALLNSNEVFNLFRSEFIGKCSQVHFFWGSFDLAVSRFSGRKAPMHPGGVLNLPDWIVRDAYSHEVSSCGFWPGNEAIPFAAFYSYIYPEPPGFKTASIKPESAWYHIESGEFILPYSIVQQSANPSGVLLDFLTTTYCAAADFANWDRLSLEK